MLRILLSLFLLLFFLPLSVQAQERFVGLSADQIMLRDFETGQILYNKNGYERMPTSSMSKVMTMYVVFDALKSGRLNLQDRLKVSEKAWRKGGSKMFIEVGDTVLVEDLIKGVIVQSGNDATIALAEGIAGTEEAFADLLNEAARELGMEDSQFANASGWPDPRHYSTAYDQSVLAEGIMQQFPEYYGYYQIKSFTYNDITQRNRNPLLFRDDLNVDGIKTGHTEVGGYGLMASGYHDGRRVILVMNGMESERARANESARVISWGLKSFENETLVKAGEVVDEALVRYGKYDSVPMTVAEDFLLTLPKDGRADLKIAVRYDAPLVAPIQRGDEVGTLVVSYADDMMEDVTIPLIAAKSVSKASIVSRMFSNISHRLLGGA